MNAINQTQLASLGLHLPTPEHNLANLAARLYGLPSPCPPLQHPSLARLEQAKVQILLLIDGMGEAQLDTLAPDGWLARHRTMTLSSVFPSTTTSAITTLLTGLPPSQHTLTGWHVAAPELDGVVIPLPLNMRQRGTNTPEDTATLAATLYRTPSAMTGNTRSCFMLQPAYIADSPYSSHHGGRATRLGWRNIAELFSQLTALIREADSPRFIYAYIPDLDSTMHRHGVNHPKSRALLQQIDQHCAALASSLHGQDATLCITADHGQQDIPPEKMLFVSDFPALAACLRQPLSGEPRVAFCHVKAEWQHCFADIAEQTLGHAAWCLPAQQLLDENWFGPDANERLAARVGDFVLLMKDDWGLLDEPENEPRPKLIGNHGGLSAAEMQIPLLVVDGLV